MSAPMQIIMSAVYVRARHGEDEYVGEQRDLAEADYGGQHYRAVSRNGASMKLARMLVEAGAPDVPVEARGPDGHLRFTSPSLHRLARLTVHESDQDGPALIRRGEFSEDEGRLDHAPEDVEAPAGFDGASPALTQPQVDALISAIEIAGCYPAPVFQNGRITEVAVFRRRQWFGSIVRNPDGGLMVLGETGERLLEESRPAPAVRGLLQGRTKRRAKPTATVTTRGTKGATAGILPAMPPTPGDRNFAEPSEVQVTS
jgi:hypothetical protein